MRYNQFSSLLLEYSRQITAEKLGPALVKTATKDSTFVQSPGAAAAQSLMQDPERMQQFISTVLEKIEQQDPTPNKEYTPWLARMYANKSVKIEDMNRDNVLGAFHAGKRRKLIKPEHADINRFKTFTQFEDAISSYGIDNLLKRKDNADKGSADEVLKTDEVRVLRPKDQAAACYYGQNTKWCTASRENNMFDRYNNEGSLYILIPTVQKYPAEKYQISPSTSSYMNEKDQPISTKALRDRFPSIKDWLKKIGAVNLFYDIGAAGVMQIFEDHFSIIDKALVNARYGPIFKDILINQTDAEGYTLSEISRQAADYYYDVIASDIEDYEVQMRTFSDLSRALIYKITENLAYDEDLGDPSGVESIIYQLKTVADISDTSISYTLTLGKLTVSRTVDFK